MKQEVRLMLEYECYPIWIYDAHGGFIDNDLVDEIKQDDTLTAMLEELQEQFDSLYQNTKQEFRYRGFSSEEERQAFAKKVQQTYERLYTLLDGKYTVQNMVDVQKL